MEIILHPLEIKTGSGPSRPASLFAAFATIFVCLVGFGMSGNLILATGGSLRLLDLLMVVGSGFFIINFLFRRFSKSILWVLLLIGYFSIFVLRGQMDNDISLVFSSTRCIMALMTGIMVGTFLQDNPRRMPIFCLTAGVGALVVAWISLGQLLFRTPFYMDFLPFDAQLFWFDGALRASGIWSHPNSLAQMQALGTMLALSLMIFPGLRRGYKITGFVLFVSTVLITYATTQTRSYLLVSAISLMIAMNAGTGRTVRAWIQLVSICFVILLPFLARPILGERWFGETSQGQTALFQAGERLMTKFEAFRLVISNPIGYGFEGRLEAQLTATGNLSASHDAILSFTLTYGLPIGVILVVILLSCFHRMLYVWTWPHPLFLPLLAVTILFQFEDSLFSPSMMLFLTVTYFSVHPPYFYRRNN